ncbi:MAG: hypothetical protein ACREHF_02500 [Rhizomicrobium sp.]
MNLFSLFMFGAAGLVVGPVTLAAQSTSPSQAISANKATAAFVEVHALCTAEHGRLWGHSLCVPMMFVDPGSREAVLNRPANGAVKVGAIYRLTLPQDIGIANTSFNFQGKRWSMVTWPLPANTVERDILLMHESYHSIQPALGLQGNGGLGKNGELDSRDGRIWLRAEFSALRAALQTSGRQRKQALADALLFRVYRMSLWPHAATDERNLELNEGLAESTGIDASRRSSDARVTAAIHDIDSVERERSFVRSFAYATGPAYAELLDAVQPDWRREVTPKFAFGKAAAAAYHVAMPKPDKNLALAAIGKYDGKQIIAQEDVRAKVTAVRNARFTKALVDGPTLTLPLAKFSISFDPRKVYSLPGQGSVYQTLTLGDAWGSLNVHDDGLALIPSTFGSVTVPLEKAPSGLQLAGKDWSLSLKKDYRFQPDPHHKGSFIVTRVVP